MCAWLWLERNCGQVGIRSRSGSEISTKGIGGCRNVELYEMSGRVNILYEQRSHVVNMFLSFGW